MNAWTHTPLTPERIASLGFSPSRLSTPGRPLWTYRSAGLELELQHNPALGRWYIGRSACLMRITTVEHLRLCLHIWREVQADDDAFGKVASEFGKEPPLD